MSYSSAIGSLMYVMVCSHLDLSYDVSMVSRYMINLGKEYWAMQWILQYKRGAANNCLQFERTKDEIKRSVDSNYTGDLDKRRYLLHYMYLLLEVVLSIGKLLCKV